jgi:hypothetical protein
MGQKSHTWAPLTASLTLLRIAVFETVLFEIISDLDLH